MKLAAIHTDINEDGFTGIKTSYKFTGSVF